MNETTTILNEKENVFTAFSFSDFDKQNTISFDIIKSGLFNKIKSILYNVHDNHEKHNIKSYNDRLNFACPYCGDSFKLTHRKRGNLYYDSMSYHCFNCSKHISVHRLLEDFSSYCDITPDELLYYKSSYKVKLQNKLSVDFLNVELFSKYSFSKEYLMKQFGFENINSSIGETYLINRLQKIQENYAWDPNTQGVVLFNMDVHKNVIGFQIRVIKNNARIKYYSYTLKQIYEKLSIVPPEDIDDLDKFSLLYGILNMNLDLPVTILEGPFDSHFIKNSIALSTIGKHLPFEIENMRYLFDYDEEGIKKSRQYLSDGKCVFLWKTYLQDLNITWPNDKKIDVNDLIIYCHKNSIPLKPFGDYFTQNKFDIYFL